MAAAAAADAEAAGAGRASRRFSFAAIAVRRAGCSVQHLLAHSIVTVEEIKEILNHFRIVEYSSEILDLLVTASNMFVSQ